MLEEIGTDVLVVGAGGAGMRAAYEANLAGASVLLAVKGRFGAIGTRGGGGTAAGISETGSIRPVGSPESRPGERLQPDEVYEDVIQCGLGMADPQLVRILVDDALSVRQSLDSWGLVPSFAEGFGVKTHGVPVSVALQRVIYHSDVEVRERTTISDLLVRQGRCVGALALDERSGDHYLIKAKSTILATGGLGHLYRLNFHPSCVTGDGYAMGYEAGAELFNLEFHQIFIETVAPTTNLVHHWLWDLDPHLTNTQGDEFIERYLPAGASVRECLEQRRQHHPFSTRDSLSRYIDVGIMGEVKAGQGTAHGGVFVTLGKAGGLRPDLVEWYGYRGVHWDDGPVEIGVGHHCCDGGFRIDEHAQTTVPGLFAAGEVAAGPHGADRMGGNMLLASQVFGARAGRQAAKQAAASGPVAVDAGQVADLERTVTGPHEGSLPVAEAVRMLGDLAWRDLLVPRSEKGLIHALGELTRMREEDLPRLDSRTPLDLAQASEFRNGLRAAELVARAALTRQESRGGHFREDFPTQDDANWLKVVTLQKGDGDLTVSSRRLDPEWKPRTTDMWGKRWG